MSDRQGSPVEETAFYPFGHQRNGLRPRALRESYDFTEKEQDTESSLHYFEARFLKASLGRFNRVDPLSKIIKPDWASCPQKLNLYAYCTNNPLKFRDFEGQDTHLVVGIDSLFGGSPFLLGGVFLGGGTSIGISFPSGGSTKEKIISARPLIQFQAKALVGAGAFAGVGLEFSGSHSQKALKPGLSIQNIGHGEINVGWGPSGGAELEIDKDSFGGTLQSLTKKELIEHAAGKGKEIGVGFGAAFGIGLSRQVTYAFPTLKEIAEAATKGFQALNDANIPLFLP